MKVYRWIQSYLLWALPFVVGTMLWSTFKGEGDVASSGGFFARALWEVLSWNLMLWFAVLILFFFSLVVSSDAREQILRRVARLSERDEREEAITGKAARATYLATLSLLSLLLFFSIFTLRIYRLPPEQAIGGKTGTVSLGMQFRLWDEPRLVEAEAGRTIFESRDLPLSKTGILLLVLVWQVGAFSLASRKALTE